MHTDGLQLELWSAAASLRLGQYAAVNPDSQAGDQSSCGHQNTVLHYL